MTQKHDYKFAELSAEVCYELSERQKLHLRFMHPNTDNVFEFIQRLRQDHENQEARQPIEQISLACESYRLYTQHSFRFLQRFQLKR